MKKKTKITKTLALALTLGLLCSGLAGCGQAQSVETVSEDLATESVQPTETVESTETVAEGTEATAENTETADGTLVRVASLKGPTSLGLLFLMNKADKGETANTYEFQMATGADEILPLMVKGDLDIALVPANVASVLYHKTQGGVEVIDINTLGVLYMVSGEDGLTNFTDLKGKTIYLTGKGTTPDYVLQYLLTANGMSADDVILEYKSEATEVASVLAEDPTAIGLLPQPFVTAACMQNDALKVIFDLNEEWNKVQGEDGSSMVTGVTVVRKEFLEENEEAVKSFMEDHKASAEDINADPATGAALAVEAAQIQTKISCHPVTLKMAYSLYGKVSYQLPQLPILQQNADFGDTVTLSLLVPAGLTASFQADMIELTNGEISIQVGEQLDADFAEVADRLPPELL